MTKEKTAKLSIILYTLINLILIGGFLFVIFEFGEFWFLSLAQVPSGGLMFIGVILMMFLNTTVILYYTRK
ncbi:MAG: hypothetical protein WC465_00230 [Patescibacteria group bacterium]